MIDKHKKVDFVIAGQPKSGTTALAQFLAEHPQVCMSYPKEPNYFVTDFWEKSDAFHGKRRYYPIRTPSEYDKCFKHCEPEQLLGEATPDYLYSESAAKEIFNHNPSSKIIIMLRNPVDFIHSLHMQLVNATLENEKDFAKAIKLERERRRGKNTPERTRFPEYLLYTERGKYYKQLKRYFDTFPAKNILILTNEEFRNNNAETFKKVLALLEIDESFSPQFKTVKGSQTPRFKTLNRVVHTPWIKKTVYKLLPPSIYVKIPDLIHTIVLKDRQRQPIKPEVRAELERLFFPDIEKASNLLERDLVKEWGLNAHKKESQQSEPYAS